MFLYAVVDLYIWVERRMYAFLLNMSACQIFVIGAVVLIRMIGTARYG